MTDRTPQPTKTSPISRDKLAEFAPFNILSPKYLDEAIGALRFHKVLKGKLIFKRGKQLSQRFFLISGTVDLIDNAFDVNRVEAKTERSAVALNQESPSTVSAIAKADCILFSIESEILDRLIGWSQAVDEPAPVESNMSTAAFGVEEMTDDGAGDWMSSLLQSPLFTRIPMTQVQELFTRFEDYVPKKGQQVIREGERGEFFYVIAAGTARITNKSGSVDLEIGPGQYFGEESLIGNTLRNATVTMTSTGMLKRLNADDFKKLLIAPVLQYLELEKLESLDKPYKLIDVKMPIEYRVQHVAGSANVPLSRLRQTLRDFDYSHVYAVPADAGSRADIAVHLLCQAGFDAVILKNSDLQKSA